MLALPKIFQRIWIGPPMPKLFEEFGERWAQLHPGWEMRLWNETNLPELENQDIYDRAEEICPAYVGQLRSDIARYELLYKYGGVYIDTDFEPLKPIDKLLEDVECFTAWEIQDQFANNAIFGCIPGHPFLRALIDGLHDSIDSYPQMGPWMISGPRYMTRVLSAFPEVTVFPQKWFYPIRCREIHKLGQRHLYEDAYGLHHWANTHRKKGKPLL